VLSLLEKGCSAIDGIGTLRNVQRKHSLVAAISFLCDVNREARKAQPLGLLACCLALLRACACPVLRACMIFAFMYLIVDTIGELDSVVRLNKCLRGTHQCKTRLSAFLRLSVAHG
jgi:hypothetical protein